MKKYFSSFLILFLFVICVSAQTKETLKLDEFSTVNCEEYLARMDGVLLQAKKNPSATIHILVYEGKERISDKSGKEKSVFPAYGSAKAKIRSMKGYIMLHNVSVKQFKFAEAGFREETHIEFWLVPSNAKSPETTPTLTKMKYRKGKAKGFCLGCCG